jgi:transcriptional regulator with XRE-family HTH domain
VKGYVTYDYGQGAVRVPGWFPGAFERLGPRLREARKEAGMKQADVAEAAGTTKHRLSRYENGHVVPSVPTLAALAFAVGKSLDSLVFGEVISGGEPGTVSHR